MGFLKPLRAAQIARTTVVILANKKFLDLEAPTINKFSDVLFVQGTPFNDDHLLAVNVQLSRLCVIIDASETTKKLGDDTHPAADTQFPALSKYFNRHGTAVRATSAVAEFIRKHHDRTTTLPENITAAVADIASRIISPSQEASIKESVEASIKEYLLEVRSYDSEYKKTATEKIMKLLRQRDRKHERLIRFIKTLYESSQQWDIGVIEKFVDISIDKRRDASSAETANKVKEVLVNFRNECEHLLEARTPQLLKSCGSEILEDIKGLMRNFRQYVFPSGEIFTCMHHEALDCISWNQNIIGSSKVTVDSSNHSFINAMMIKCYRDVEVFDVIRLLLINGYKNAFHENLSRKISGCPFVGNQAILTQLYAVSKDGTITGFRKRHNADITAERQGIDVQILARQPASTSSAAAAVSGAVRSSPTENFPREGRDVTVHGGDKRPEEIDLPIADVNCSFGTFSEEAMKTGYLVLGTEFPVDKNILMRDMPDGCSLVVLERPWYVAARQRLIKAVMDWWANNGKPEPKRWQRFMEILPSYVLSRTERESGVNIGNPYMDHSPTKWLKAYYGITKDVFNLLNPVTSESEDCGATGENSGKGKALDTSTELKKLPMAIFHFIRETYNNPTADFENKSPGTYYYDTGNDEALKNSHNISWNNILAVCSNGTLTSA
ncbi:uncharacterized protein LOC129597302 [Paramacrobiotus metropolitanus]|uniref:uncharacterized protein LOC129597302 n=1 Tax=Paramacrobiotus metropolitanus TaxID=2943436 RepID=UPI0024458DC2|nr:uncharacterized protein LOC129597302 [Paramacrobiotus metropolitanus]